MLFLAGCPAGNKLGIYSAHLLKVYGLSPVALPTFPLLLKHFVMVKVVHNLLMRSYNSCSVLLLSVVTGTTVHSFWPLCKAFCDSLIVEELCLTKFNAGMGEL